jgi:hypothetical protein
LTLYTDLSGREIDILPAVFEQAFPQMCDYFGVNADQHADWHMTGCLMKDKRRFALAGLLPDNLPEFAHGFSAGSMLWLNEQPSDYYRRHLLLHEGVHAFMFTFLGSCGPPWYMEGMAEYLSTHRWKDGVLTLRYMPQQREEVPEWGRIRIIQDAVAERKAMRLRAVIESPSTGHRDTASYAWRWAAVTLLDRHPRYQERFRILRDYVNAADFNERFYRLFETDWQPLCEEWQLMVANLEYGYDVVRNAVDFTPGKPLPPPPPVPVTKKDTESPPVAAIAVAADRGWQNAGVRLEAGTTYRLTASGRYQIAKGRVAEKSRHRAQDENPPTSAASGDKGKGDRGEPASADADEPIWWCEPGGVTIRYYRGRPLGILLAAVRPDQPRAESTTALLYPAAIGLEATLTPKESGTLFLKVNDSAGELDDNAGQLTVDIRR